MGRRTLKKDRSEDRRDGKERSIRKMDRTNRQERRTGDRREGNKRRK